MSEENVEIVRRMYDAFHGNQRTQVRGCPPRLRRGRLTAQLGPSMAIGRN
jgi:hypothetical protein